MTEERKHDHTFKVVFAGDFDVGKTNLLSRFVCNKFNPELKPTTGIGSSHRLVTVDEKVIEARIWDAAGRKRLRILTSAYYGEADGVFLVYDITRRASYNNIMHWLEEIRGHASSNIVIMLVGNKSDLNHKRAVPTDEAQAFAIENNFSFIETSALDASNVEEMFQTLLTDIYRAFSSRPSELLVTDVEKGSIDAESSADTSASCSKCCTQ